jgi:hypothetical protein
MRPTSAVLLALALSGVFAVTVLVLVVCRPMVLAQFPGIIGAAAPPLIPVPAPIAAPPVNIALIASTAPAVDTSPIDPSAPVTPGEITADNWREVLVRLDNIYTDPAVLRERNAAVGKFISLMEASDTQTVWAQREGIRKAAARELVAHESGLRQLLANAPPAARDEAAVALLEEDSLAREFSAVVAAGAPLTHRLGPGPLRDQATFYLINGYVGIEDSDSSAKCLKDFVQTNGNAVMNHFWGPRPPLGLLRAMATHFSMAQDMDDFAVMLPPGNERTADWLASRDKWRAEAAELYKKFEPKPATTAPAK